MNQETNLRPTIIGEVVLPSIRGSSDTRGATNDVKHIRILGGQPITDQFEKKARLKSETHRIHTNGHVVARRRRNGLLGNKLFKSI